MVNFFLEVDFENTSDEFTSVKARKVKLIQISVKYLNIK